MDEQSKHVEIVEKAQRGDEKCMDRLAELARERLRVYVYRLTLEEDLTQEIVQESMLEMCKVLGKLKRADRFWPWLYGIAVNKIHRHRRTERTQKKLAMSRAENSGTFKERQQGLENLVGQELKQVVGAAMNKLKTRHRAVLVMRCYDGMSYGEIADSMKCSEFGSRMLFVRAKRSLQRELSKNGFGKGSLLAALVLFGKMTSGSEAAAAEISVTAATTKVGLLASVVGLVTSKTAVVSLTAAGVLAVGTVAVTSRPARDSNQWRNLGEGRAVPSFLGQDGSSGEENWYYFPDGPSGSMMLRAKCEPHGGQDYSEVLQNDLANYYRRGNTVHINNYRLYSGDLSVVRLPTDSADLTSFLSRVEGDKGQIQRVPNTEKGLLVVATRNPEDGSNCAWLTRHYNVLDEDFFQCDWPAPAKVVDRRDGMHKRGWTYFTVTGQVNGREVAGRGRMPFVYAAIRLYSPWLKLAVGDELTIVDSASGAYLRGGDGARIAGYRGGSFFRGLSRPWMGLHTIDTVRRDAAEREVWFETKHSSGSDKADVELTIEEVKLLYTIDLKRDVIDRIRLSVDGEERGELTFAYMEDVEGAGGDFSAPGRGSYRIRPAQDTGLLWLARLAEGSLGE
jgi:RNA polymerase sigma-70 factor (ECF subfamily)